MFDHDIEAIITTHARDRRVAAWLEDTAQAFEEIGEADLAIEWAKRATDFNDGHQSLRAAQRWCRLLAEHRPDEVLPARLTVFRRWPSSSTATHLYRDAGSRWPEYRAEVLDQLATHPRDAVLFAHLTLADLPMAWTLAHDLQLTDDDTWAELAKAYEKLDPWAVLPVLARLVDHDLANTRSRALPGRGSPTGQDAPHRRRHRPRGRRRRAHRRAAPDPPTPTTPAAGVRPRRPAVTRGTETLGSARGPHLALLSTGDLNLSPRVQVDPCPLSGAGEHVRRWRWRGTIAGCWWRTDRGRWAVRRPPQIVQAGTGTGPATASAAPTPARCTADPPSHTSATHHPAAAVSPPTVPRGASHEAGRRPRAPG